MKKQIIINRDDIAKEKIDIEGRDLVIGFGEPAFRSEEDAFVVDAPLNARLISYFLPAVQIARAQRNNRRPQLFAISGIRAAIKWNAKSEHERKVMTMNNNLKKLFIREVLTKFFPDVFSLIDVRDTIDFLKIPDNKLKELWEAFRNQYPQEISDIEKQLQKFRPDVARGELLFNYALAHLFAFGDMNFDWDIWNSKGFCSIGGQQEVVFNRVRELGFNFLKNIGETFFERQVTFFDNMKIIINDTEKLPPPYNGAHRKIRNKDDLDEVTYENGRGLDYYDSRQKQKAAMDYVYSLIPREQFEQFWSEYRLRYEDLKKRYIEGYEITT